MDISEYEEMLKTEQHHGHEIVVIDGVLRWKENPLISHLVDNTLNLNDLLRLLNTMGYDKNSEVYRKLYRNMGYSLSGYWEIFYWELNNPDCHLYQPPVN